MSQLQRLREAFISTIIGYHNIQVPTEAVDPKSIVALSFPEAKESLQALVAKISAAANPRSSFYQYLLYGVELIENLQNPAIEGIAKEESTTELLTLSKHLHTLLHMKEYSLEISYRDQTIVCASMQNSALRGYSWTNSGQLLIDNVFPALGLVYTCERALIEKNIREMIEEHHQLQALAIAQTELEGLRAEVSMVTQEKAALASSVEALPIETEALKQEIEALKCALRASVLSEEVAKKELSTVQDPSKEIIAALENDIALLQKTIHDLQASLVIEKERTKGSSVLIMKLESRLRAAAEKKPEAVTVVTSPPSTDSGRVRQRHGFMARPTPHTMEKPEEPAAKGGAARKGNLA